MIELFVKDICSENRQSSKGNQLKWNTGGRWYKADQSGYQGLAEYTVSCLLKYSDLKPEMITMYETEQIKYRSRIQNGCSSADFLICPHPTTSWVSSASVCVRSSLQLS